ncbi:hypothetical protein WJX84_002228 [Apatococcus fuscideae]|uniref:Uncharacterized protein n=1 Tax=Apatococcus fuscideae TaxID=2026836 RepID=A0AAW1T3P8_9CHLO
MGEETDKEKQLSTSELFLRMPDAVMEPDVLSVLRTYVREDGGKPKTAVEELSESFVGYAHMASLVCKWLQQSEDPSRTPGAEATPQDEAFFLKGVIQERFDPEKLDSVLRSKEHTPAWVGGLTSDRIGRQLIYDLSGVHRNSLMLNFAVQKILADGHDQEVASIGSNLAGYFGVYHRTVATRLKKAVGATVKELEALTSELKESVCQGEHTYVHAQHLLSHLSRTANGSIFRRISQDLESHAARLHEGAVWRLQPSFQQQSSMEEPNSQAVACIVAEILANPTEKKYQGSFPAAPVEQLANLYNSSNPPSFFPARHPKVLSILLKALFSAQAISNQKQRETIISILSKIVSAQDDRPSGGDLDLSRTQETAISINAALELCSEAVKGKSMSPAAQEAAEQLGGVFGLRLAHIPLVMITDPHLAKPFFDEPKSPLYDPSV